MYDWISQFDPNFSLQALADNVREQFRQVYFREIMKKINIQYGESSGDEICSHFDGLVAHAKKEMREIKGINVRLSQLDQNLGMADGICKEIAIKVHKIVQSTPISDPYAMQVSYPQ